MSHNSFNETIIGKSFMTCLISRMPEQCITFSVYRLEKIKSLKFTRTKMYLLAFDRINKLDVFFSSCICGSWRFNCSKHSLRCARLFFSSLLWTSRVPALWMEALRCVPLIHVNFTNSYNLNVLMIMNDDGDKAVDLISLCCCFFSRQIKG